MDSARNPCGFKRDRVINSYRPFVSKLRSCPRVAPSVCFPHSKNHLSLQMGFTRNRIGVRRRKGQNPPCSTRAHLNEITVILPKTTTSSHPIVSPNIVLNLPHPPAPTPSVSTNQTSSQNIPTDTPSPQTFNSLIHGLVASPEPLPSSLDPTPTSSPQGLPPPSVLPTVRTPIRVKKQPPPLVLSPEAVKHSRTLSSGMIEISFSNNTLMRSTILYILAVFAGYFMVNYLEKVDFEPHSLVEVEEEIVGGVWSFESAEKYIISAENYLSDVLKSRSELLYAHKSQF